MSEFMRLKIGPVIMKDEMEYFREVHLLEESTLISRLPAWPKMAGDS
jgi:hypothetical protein